MYTMPISFSTNSFYQLLMFFLGGFGCFFSFVLLIVGQLRLEEIFKPTQIQLPVVGKDMFHYEQAALDPIQPGLNISKGIHSFCGKPVPVTHHPYSEELCHNI